MRARKEIGTAKNYFHLLKISAKVYVYLKYIYDILKNDKGNSLRKTKEISCWVDPVPGKWLYLGAG